jgi:hypothetical protein
MNTDPVAYLLTQQNLRPIRYKCRFAEWPAGVQSPALLGLRQDQSDQGEPTARIHLRVTFILDVETPFYALYMTIVHEYYQPIYFSIGAIMIRKITCIGAGFVGR